MYLFAFFCSIQLEVDDDETDADKYFASLSAGNVFFQSSDRVTHVLLFRLTLFFLPLSIFFFWISSPRSAKSTPNMLDIGVDPEDFNKAKDEYIDIEGAEDDS